MPPSITLEVTHPDVAPGRIEGFRFLWAFYVSGYHPDRHCQRCFRGRRAEGFGLSTAAMGPMVLDRMGRYKYVYVCGVGAGPKSERRSRSLHLPLSYAEGAVAEMTTYNGYVILARNAVSLLPIEQLPSGYDGKREEHVHCKNYQFAVQHFGVSHARDQVSHAPSV